MLNFSQGEEGKQVLQKENKGIRKAIEIMLKSREEKLLENTGAKLLGNISSHDDL
jgi:hypothetical protein